MNYKYLLVIAIMCFSGNVFSQLIIPKKKCTRGKCYFVDQTGKRISEYYESVRAFKDNLAPVQLDGKWGYVNDSMEIVIPLNFSKVGNFNNGISYVQKDKEFYLIDTTGEKKSEIYDLIEIHQSYYLVKKADKFGLLDAKGEVKEAIRFDKITTYYKGDFGVKLDGKWANYNDGNLNFDNPTIYFSSPEEKPVFSKNCKASEDSHKRDACSQEEMLQMIYHNIRYPAEARRKGIEGTVVVRFNINEEGRVENPEILKNVGAGCGDQALEVTKTYLSKWASPGMENGEPVNTVFVLPVKFKLD